MEQREKIADWLRGKFAILKTRDISATQIGLDILSDEGKVLSRSSISQYKAGAGVSRQWIERFCAFYGFDFPAHLFSVERTSDLTAALAAINERLDRIERETSALVSGRVMELAKLDEAVRLLGQVVRKYEGTQQ